MKPQNFDNQLPEYIQIVENVTVASRKDIKSNEEDILIESILFLTEIEFNDVGFFTCSYSKYLASIDEQITTNSNQSNSIYVFVTGKKNQNREEEFEFLKSITNSLFCSCCSKQIPSRF